jgi:hypothetical protein
VPWRGGTASWVWHTPGSPRSHGPPCCRHSPGRESVHITPTRPAYDLIWPDPCHHLSICHSAYPELPQYFSVHLAGGGAAGSEIVFGGYDLGLAGGNNATWRFTNVISRVRA